MRTNLPPNQQLAEVEELLRTAPEWERMRIPESENFAWYGRAAAVVKTWDDFKAIQLGGHIDVLQSGRTNSDGAYSGLMTILHQMRHDLRMKTVGPLSVAIGPGFVFDYFDEVRKVIEGARIGIFFIDPYLDAEFVTRYLPHVAAGVKVRLLGREKIKSLIPATQLFKQQSSLEIEVKSHAEFHDRYVFIDNSACYQSGASFKDGARKTPTTLTQIGDAFTAMRSTYENLWDTGTAHP